MKRNSKLLLTLKNNLFGTMNQYFGSGNPKSDLNDLGLPWITTLNFSLHNGIIMKDFKKFV